MAKFPGMKSAESVQYNMIRAGTGATQIFPLRNSAWLSEIHSHLLIINLDWLQGVKNVNTKN